MRHNSYTRTRRRRGRLLRAIAIHERARAPVLGLRQARAAARPATLRAVLCLRQGELPGMRALLRHRVPEGALAAAQGVAQEEGPDTAARISNSGHKLAQARRVAAESLAAATDEYGRLVAQTDQLRFGNEQKAAMKLAKKAIELDPQRSAAHFALAASYAGSGDHLRASVCCYSAIERAEPDSEDWAQAVFYAWESRRCAAPCRSLAIFCGCERCAALPAKPAWMATPEALLAMSERVVAAAPGKGKHWKMHASAHWHTKSWPTASKSYAKAARLFGDQGNESGKAAMLGNAQDARDKAEAEAKAAAEAEAARDGGARGGGQRGDGGAAGRGGAGEGGGLAQGHGQGQAEGAEGQEVSTTQGEDGGTKL